MSLSGRELKALATLQEAVESLVSKTNIGPVEILFAVAAGLEHESLDACAESVANLATALQSVREGTPIQ